jgi:hypothetical protein
MVLSGALLVAGGGSASAQGLGFDVARLGNVATTFTLTGTLRGPLGSQSLVPERGETIEAVGSDWIFFLQGGVGVSLAADQGSEDRPTIAAELGLLRRLPLSVPDHAGCALVMMAEPLAAGPALRLEVFRALALEAGGLWHDDGLGFRWFAATEVSAAFLMDVLGGS